MTLIGAAISTKTGQTNPDAISAFEDLTGSYLRMRRCYDSGVPTSISTSAMRHDLGQRKSLYSFKPTSTTDLATLETFAATIETAAHDCDVVIYHEPADNMSAQSFKALYRRSCGPFRDRGIPVGVIFTNWTCNLPRTDAKSVLPAYYPGDDVVDFIGIDEYPGKGGVSNPDFTPMINLTERVSQFADAHNKPLGLAEYGVDNTWNVQSCELWMRRVTEWVRWRDSIGSPLRWFSYFHSNVAGNWWLDNHAEYVDAYKDAIAITQ